MRGANHNCLLKGQAQYCAKCSLYKFFHMVFFDWNFEIHSFLLGYPRWWNQMTSYIVEIRQVYGSFNYILIFKPWKSNSNQESDSLPSLLVQLQIAQWKLLDVNCLNPLEWEDYRCWFWACKKQIWVQLLRILYSLYAVNANCLQKILVAPDYVCLSGVNYGVYSVWRLLWWILRK